MAVAGGDESQLSDSGLDRDDDIVRAPRHGELQPPRAARHKMWQNQRAYTPASRRLVCLAPLVIVLVLAAVIFVVLKLTGVI
jgi:hypothetical protein